MKAKPLKIDINFNQKNRYQEGQLVFPKKRPSVTLIVKRYHHKIYYCSFAEFPERQELAFFEREILAKSPV